MRLMHIPETKTPCVCVTGSPYATELLMSYQHAVLRLHRPVFRLVLWLPLAKTPRSAISKQCCVTAISRIMLNAWTLEASKVSLHPHIKGLVVDAASSRV